LASHAWAATQAAADNATRALGSQEAFGWAGYFEALAGVFLILAILVAGFWLVKRYGSRAGLRMFGRGDLQLEGTLSLGAKRSVVVVRFLNKRLVLGVTDANINLLTELDDHDQDFDQALENASRETPRGDTS
jgi:flagellar protein FliO/FliZ